MAKTIAPRTFDEAVNWLRAHGFELLEAPGTADRIFIKKYKCSAAIEKTQDGGVRILPIPETSSPASPRSWLTAATRSS